MEDKSVVSPPCNTNEMTIKFLDVTFNKIYFLFEGMGSINSFRGGYNVLGEELIEMAMVNKTHIAGSAELTKYESQFFNSLFNTKSYSIKNNSLTFDIEGSNDKLLFVKK